MLQKRAYKDKLRYFCNGEQYKTCSNFCSSADASKCCRLSSNKDKALGEHYASVGILPLAASRV